MSQLSKGIEEKFKALRERYSPQPVPKCHICGAEMTVQRMSASRITYCCTGATYDDAGCHYSAGRSIADDHYEQSRVTVVDVSDPDVLALLDEFEAEKRVSSTWRKTAESILEKLEAAEKRVAELEAREVKLSKLSVDEVMHLSGFSRDYAEGWCAGNDNARHEIQVAGIRLGGLR
ncbi:ead/Ea22-like family protein [Salmonella enterica]|nr:ead/Ea22-like family protein [Salmonella enterica]EHK5999348.1 ead/Ea22-like family protein [Salmonella enterica]EIF5124567.1 ead/Ea22-like family protein [Salmonella enterica]EIF5348743.1 ead/Ea22-like family protein [Salmonella enterica]EIF5657340.1 ead/Ea22-like family protein [Salmonella enterica]